MALRMQEIRALNTIHSSREICKLTSSLATTHIEMRNETIYGLMRAQMKKKERTKTTKEIRSVEGRKMEFEGN